MAKQQDPAWANKKLQKSYMTPIGTFAFPRLTSRDQFNKYSVSLILDPSDPETVEMLSGMNEQLEKAGKVFEMVEGKELPPTNPLFKPHKDRDGNETGQIQMAFSKKSQKFRFVDASGRNEIPIAVVQNMPLFGATARIATYVKPYYTPPNGPGSKGAFGLSKYLQGIQIIQVLVSVFKGLFFP